MRRCRSSGCRPLAGLASLIWAAWLACSRQLRIAMLAVAGVVAAVRVAASCTWRRAVRAVVRAASPSACPVRVLCHGLSRAQPRAAGWQVGLIVLLCAVSGASADVRGHLWGEPSRAYFAALEHVEYPTPRPGRPLYDRAELLQELHFCQGYHPDAMYVVQVHNVAFDGSLSPRGWTATTVAEIRWYIETGRFLQHWYVYDPTDADVLDPAVPQGGYDEAPTDCYDRLSLECDLCGETFDASSIDGTRDWRGTGMDCCGCGNECSSNASAIGGAGATQVGLAYDARAEVIRFVAMSRAERVAAHAAPARNASRRHRLPGRGHSRGLGSRNVLSGPYHAAHDLRRRVGAIAAPAAGSGVAPLRQAAFEAAPVGARLVGARIVSEELRACVSAAVSATARSNAERAHDVSNYVAARVESDVATMQADESHLALRPHDWSLVRGLLTASNAATERRVPNTTKKQDRCNWRKWDTFCKMLDTPPIRDDIRSATGADPAGYVRECTLVELAFMFWITNEPQYLVTSMLQRLRGVSRIHKVSLRLPFVPLAHLVQVCKGLVQERIDDQGPESLVRKQKEPLQNWMIIKWLSLTHGVIGGVTVGANLQWQGIRCMIAYFASTGARKADVALDAGASFGLRHLALWNATWEIRGEVVLQPTADQLAALCVLCYVHLTPVPCKNDPDGCKFAGTPTTCRYHPTAPINFARELAAYEIMRGTEAVDRRRTPMLLSPNGLPWRKAALDRFFKLMLTLVVGAAAAVSYSVHSFRIYLACALHAQGASAERIMMMLRWSSTASLLVYCRPNASTVAGWVHSAADAAIDAVRANTLATNRAVRPGGAAAAPTAGSHSAVAPPAAAAAPATAAPAGPAAPPGDAFPPAGAAATTAAVHPGGVATPVLAASVVASPTGLAAPPMGARLAPVAVAAAAAATVVARWLGRAVPSPGPTVMAHSVRSLAAAGPPGPSGVAPALRELPSGGDATPLGSGGLGEPVEAAPTRQCLLNNSAACSAVASGCGGPSGDAAAASGTSAETAPSRDGWLMALAPPPPPSHSLSLSDLTHGAQYQNIARVVVTDVVPVDDDNIIAALKGSLPALERAAAACDAETEHGFAAGAVYSPISPDDQAPDDPSDDDGE